MNVLSRDRTDHFIHLFVERRADLARALTTAAKVAATQAFRASLAELTHEMVMELIKIDTRPSLQGWAATLMAAGLTKAELVEHTGGAMEILEALGGKLSANADFLVAFRNEAAQ